MQFGYYTQVLYFILGPQLPQQSYPDPSSFMSAPQQPPIFAPPHPHPQFIQDPTILNYVPPQATPVYPPPSYHSSGFQGYPQIVSLNCSVLFQYQLTSLVVECGVSGI